MGPDHWVDFRPCGTTDTYFMSVCPVDMSFGCLGTEEIVRLGFGKLGRGILMNGIIGES